VLRLQSQGMQLQAKIRGPQICGRKEPGKHHETSGKTSGG
jgi:hypothetical protein